MDLGRGTDDALAYARDDTCTVLVITLGYIMKVDLPPDTRTYFIFVAVSGGSVRSFWVLQMLCQGWKLKSRVGERGPMASEGRLDNRSAVFISGIRLSPQLRRGKREVFIRGRGAYLTLEKPQCYSSLTNKRSYHT